MPKPTRWAILAGCLVFGATMARAEVTLLLEEPYGAFGAMNPTGHAAIYLSRVCADTPVHLRRCGPGETGVVISRYHRVGGYDWIAIPLTAYLYAAESPEQVPASVTPDEAAELRDSYRRKYLEEIVPDESDGSTPRGDWTQLVGEAYDRTIYTYSLATSEQRDDELIERLNSRANTKRFHLLYRNCADFVRNIVDFYYPKAIHRNFTADVGIMTPKQAAKCVVHYARKHPDLQFSGLVVPQVPGTVPRSSAVRGVLESLIKSKKYFVPLTTLAVLHPLFGSGLAYALVEESHFDPKRATGSAEESPSTPKMVVSELRWNAGD